MSQYKTESFYTDTDRKSIKRWMPKNVTIQKGNYAAIQAGNTPQYRRDYLNICGRIFTSDATHSPESNWFSRFGSGEQNWCIMEG